MSNIIISKGVKTTMANKKSGSIAEVVTALAAPLADELGYVLWDVEYVREGADYYLRITIDSDEGITIDDCERFSRAIDPVLDEADPITDSYHLEVSSPGIERELKSDFHINACEGWQVEVRLYAPIDGSKSHIGELVGLDGEGNVVIEQEGGRRSFARTAIASLRTHYDFGD
jgi:ribosome maturation factor RimP